MLSNIIEESLFIWMIIVAKSTFYMHEQLTKATDDIQPNPYLG